MNTPNSSPKERIPEKVERSEDDPANAKEESTGALKDSKPQKSGGAGELAAANALRSLVDSPKKGEADEDEGEPKAENPDDVFVLPEIYTRSGRKKAIPFPLKLMKVLSCKEYSDVITWLPNGKSFSIIRPKAFTNEILPAHFKTAKYSSFTRKLHRWGFQRHLRGDDAGAFFHKYFVRNRVDLVEKMSCHKPNKPTRYGGEAASPGRLPASMRGSTAQHLAMSGMGGGVHSAMALEAAQLQRQQLEGRDSAELNDAIELEVSRRLRERIAAASLSRQALAAMQQQVQPSMMDPLSMPFNAGLNYNPHQFGGAGLSGMNSMLSPTGMGHLNAASLSPNPGFGGGGITAATAAALRDAQEQCLLLQQQSQGLDLLPNTNINHAKSA